MSTAMTSRRSDFMDKNIKATLKEIKALVIAWRIIDNDYNDGEEKEIAQKVISELLNGCNDFIADIYKED